MSDVLVLSDAVIARNGKLGGNRKPQRFRSCQQCNSLFGPIKRLSVRFCSYRCKVAAQTTGRKTFRETIPEARRAQRAVAYNVNVGKIVRPDTCEECGKRARIEAAHYNYSEPLRVRWLCRSCHVQWDRVEPKGATRIMTGGKAKRKA